MKLLSKSEIFDRFAQKKETYHSQYLAMYSSWLDGIITEPGFMIIPIDDHLVHRGDGVFEAIKVIHGTPYLLDEHLDRLLQSAQKLQFDSSVQKTEFKENIRNIIIETIKVASIVSKKNQDEFDGIARLYLSRGPGSFGTNPYDCKRPQVYCVITELNPPSQDKYQLGVTIGRSQIPVKSDWFSTVKSCNYLQNVLMKKESIDKKIDFTVSFSSDGFLAEGSTENIFIINKLGKMIHPKLDGILKGTTMTRLFDLVEKLSKKNPEFSELISISREQNISELDLLESQGVFMVGTTLDILPVKSYQDLNGKVFTLPVSEYSSEFLKMLKEDQSM